MFPGILLIIVPIDLSFLIIETAGRAIPLACNQIILNWIHKHARNMAGYPPGPVYPPTLMYPPLQWKEASFPVSKVELHISCAKLLKMNVTSSSDPMAVLHMQEKKSKKWMEVCTVCCEAQLHVKTLALPGENYGSFFEQNFDSP